MISEQFYEKKLKRKVKLHPSSAILKKFSGEILEVLGEITVNMKYQTQTKTSSVFAVKRKGPALFGTN